VRVLAVSDELDERLGPAELARLAPELILACGDVPFERLGLLADSSRAPLVFVPGNHDRDLSGYRSTRSGLVVRAGFVGEAPWPPGTTPADGRLVEAAGVVIAGLGGSPRYRSGPNQYRERQQARRAGRLIRRARWARLRHRPPVDIVLTHAAPRGVGDDDDPAHRGFACYHHLVAAIRPRVLLHGHVRPGGAGADRWIGTTRVVNVFDHRLLELDLPAPAPTPGRPPED
jgi:Calcineurin-like phosphoesterase